MNKKQGQAKKVVKPKAEVRKASERVATDIADPTRNKNIVPSRPGKQQEKTGRERERLYRSLFETGPDGIIVHDAQGRNIDANAKACEMLGYSHDELLVMRVSDLIPHEGPHREQPRLAEVIAGQTVCYERKLRRKDGTLLDVEIRASRVTEDRVQAFWRDISERKHMEKTLGESDRRYRELFENASLGIFKATLEGRLVDVNPKCARMFGFQSPGEMLAEVKDVATELYAEPDQRGENTRVHLDDPEINTFDVHYRRKDGSTFWGRLTFRTTPDLDHATYLEGFIEDISERKWAEDSLKANERQLRDILDATPFPIALVDNQDNKIEFWSRSAGSLFGHTAPTAAEWYELAYPDPDYRQDVIERWKPFLEKARLSGQTVNTGEYRVTCLDGTVRICELHATFLKDKLVVTFNDVTERKKVEQALQDRQEMLNSLLNSITESALLIKADGTILAANATAASRVGNRGNDILGLNVYSLLPDDVAELRKNMVEKAVTTGQAVKFDDVRQGRNTGNSIYPIASLSGVIDRVAIFGIDFTERKQAEDALKKSETRYRLLASNSEDVIWTLDPQFRFTYISPSIYKLRGLTPEEATKEELLNTLTPDSQQKVQKIIEDGLVEIDRGLSLSARLDIEQYRRDGSTIWVEIAVQTMRDDEGKLNGFVGISRDISDRRRAELALQESERRSRKISDLTNDITYSCLTDEDGNYGIDWLSGTTERITGYTADEIKARSCWKFMVVEEDIPLFEKHVTGLAAGQSSSCHLRIRNKGSDIKWINSQAECTADSKDYLRRRLYGGLTDITDHKHLEEEQQRVAKLESVGLLASGIAHDFNNILTSILGNISLAKMEADPASDLCGSLEQAEKASQRAKSLTAQLLTFSKGGAPVTKLASLADLLKDTVGFALHGSNVKYRLHIPAGLWNAKIDAGQVSQVIHNLVINAQQAMPAGGTIDIKAENIAINEALSLGKGLPIRTGNYVRIAVTDHGSGIDAEHLDKIFDPFFTTKPKGSGLGLATSFSIARNHGGHISVESELGSGSTFYLYLPASLETIAREQEAKTAAKADGRARILVMDDEKAVREVVGRMLKNLGYRHIEYAADGSEAIRLYKAAIEAGRPFTVAILDLTIAGGMGGKETVSNLLKIDPGVKAIVSSGYIEDSVIGKYREYGFSGMVAKPYTIDELHKAIQDVIG